MAPLTVLLATHFLSLQYLPAIGAGASVRLTRLRSRMDLDFFHFLAPINWKTNEGCVIDLNSKINRIFLSSCMNKSKDLSFMATKNEDQTKYSHLENVKKIHNDFTIIFGKSMVLVENYCEVISGYIFNKFYTKTFKIVYILFVYLFIMFI